MAQTAVRALVDNYRTVCCKAPLEQAEFSDGRGFLICSGCQRVVAVEPKRDRKSA